MRINLQELAKDNVDPIKYMIVWVITFRKYTVAGLGDVIKDYLKYYNLKHALKLMHI